MAVASIDDLESALKSALIGRPEGLIGAGGAELSGIEHRREIAAFANSHGLPSVGAGAATSRLFAKDGGLLGYGPKQLPLYRRAAYFVDRILRGAKPADLPLEQPTTFDLIINQTTAQALGITIPTELAAQVTEWVQ